MDRNQIEKLVEIITREVLIALDEKEYKKENPEVDYCSIECVDGLCVKTCFNAVGEVVEAGADRIASTLGLIPEDKNLAKFIDHTLLKPDATSDQIAQLCYEAKKYNFASVCVNPTHVELCAELLKGTPVKVCTVIGFPLGASSPEVKTYETGVALDKGATEIDMVINIGALKARDLDLVAKDIRGVVLKAKERHALVKVIIEAALLNDEEKKLACLISKEAGANFVKTSTGFASGGATVEDVALMRHVVGPDIGVKAAGGIRTREDAENMIKAGATRIGASAGIKIVQSDQQSSAPTVETAKSY